MTTQPPFRPPWERPKPPPVENLVERFRVGPWTLQAEPHRVAPRDYLIRCDRPGFPKGRGVRLDLHEGWIVYDGDERFVSREGPLACLEWFAARRQK